MRKLIVDIIFSCVNTFINIPRASFGRGRTRVLHQLLSMECDLGITSIHVFHIRYLGRRDNLCGH
jgi:hypothetical protein